LLCVAAVVALERGRGGVEVHAGTALLARELLAGGRCFADNGFVRVVAWHGSISRSVALPGKLRKLDGTKRTYRTYVSSMSHAFRSPPRRRQRRRDGPEEVLQFRHGLGRDPACH